MPFLSKDFLKTHRITLICCFVLFLLGVIVRFPGPDLIYFNLHAARDMYRSYLMVHGIAFPFFGPELSFEGRTPGPGVYFLLAIPQLISATPTFTYLFIALTGAISPVLIFLLAKRFFFEWPFALAAGLLAAVNPTAVISLRFLWNPVFLFPLCTLILWQALRTRNSGSKLNWCLFLFLGLLTIQVHFSVLIAFTAVAIYLIKKAPRKFLDALLPMAVVLAVMSIPVLLGLILTPEDFFGSWKKVEATRPGLKQIGFNYHALQVIGSLVSPDTGEDGFRCGFTHFAYFLQMSENVTGAIRLLPIKVMNATAMIANAVMLLGVIGALLALVPKSWVGKFFSLEGEDADKKRTREHIIILTLWLLLPSVLMIFYNPVDWVAMGMPEITPENCPPSYTAKRYLYQIFPALFLMSGAGVRFLWTIKRPVTPVFAGAILVGVLVAQSGLIRSWYISAETNGTLAGHGGLKDRSIPTYREITLLAEALRDEFQLGKGDVGLDKIRPGLEFGLFDLEVELDYTLRYFLREAKEESTLGEDKVVVIYRRWEVPGEIVKQGGVITAGNFKAAIITRELANRLHIAKGQWDGPYFPEVGKDRFWKN